MKNLCGSWGAIIGNSDFQERTKVGRFDDVILADSTHRSWCGKLLQHISKGKHHLDIPLFQLTLPQFEDLCRQFSCKHQLKQGLFTPHVIRHSGPSFDCIHHHRSLPQIQERGRWSCAASVNRYKRPGRLLLEASRLPAVLRNYKCEKLSATLASIFLANGSVRTQFHYLDVGVGHCAIILRLVWNAMNLINDKTNVCASHCTCKDLAMSTCFISNFV